MKQTFFPSDKNRSFNHKRYRTELANAVLDAFHLYCNMRSIDIKYRAETKTFFVTVRDSIFAQNFPSRTSAVLWILEHPQPIDDTP